VVLCVCRRRLKWCQTDKEVNIRRREIQHRGNNETEMYMFGDDDDGEYSGSEDGLLRYEGGDGGDGDADDVAAAHGAGDDLMIAKSKAKAKAKAKWTSVSTANPAFDPTVYDTVVDLPYDAALFPPLPALHSSGSSGKKGMSSRTSNSNSRNSKKYGNDNMHTQQRLFAKDEDDDASVFSSAAATVESYDAVLFPPLAAAATVESYDAVMFPPLAAASYSSSSTSFGDHLAGAAVADNASVPFDPFSPSGSLLLTDADPFVQHIEDFSPNTTVL